MAKFDESLGRLSEWERSHLLRTFDEVVPRIPVRDVREVEKELNAIRQARRSGGRRGGARRRPR